MVVLLRCFYFVKEILIYYLNVLAASVSSQIVEASIAKIVAWTSDIRSAEVRKASQDSLYALFSLHPGELTRILGTLPKVCQVNATFELSFEVKY